MYKDIFKRHFDITMSDATYYFEANKTRTIEINEELPAGVVVKYTWKKSSGETGSGNSFKDVGTYHVTATIAGGYYATTTATATLTIVRPSLSGITFTDKTFVYDGTQKKIEITGKLMEGASVSYSIRGLNDATVDDGATNGTTQVGVYEVTATFGGNLVDNTLVAYLTILKANYRVVLSNKTVTYNGNAHTLDVPDLTNKGMSIASSSVSGKELDSNHNPTKPVSATQNGENVVTRTNAGNYTITVNFNGGRNYNDTSSSATLVITPSTQTLKFEATNAYNGKGWIYDGKPHTISATAPGDVTISYSYTGTLAGNNNEFRDVGTYTLTAKIIGEPNIYDVSTSVTFTITKANLSTTLNNETFVYNGTPHTYTLKNGIVGKGDDGTFSAEQCSIVYSYTGREFAASDTNDTTNPTGGEVSVNSNQATNAGRYSPTLVITAPISVETNIQNYNDLIITGENKFIITKIAMTFGVPVVWAMSDTTFINPMTPNSELSGSISFTYTSSDTQKATINNSNAVYITKDVVDRTSSEETKQVLITATSKNAMPTSFVINLIPFRYDREEMAIIEYTSSKGNINGNQDVEIPNTLFPNKIAGGIIQDEQEELAVVALKQNTYLSQEWEGGKWTGHWVDVTGYKPVLSTSHTYSKLSFKQGISTIKYRAFYNSDISGVDLQSIESAPTMTTIESSAFESSKLDSAYLPKSLRDIPEKCFYKCVNLKTVSLVTGLVTMGVSAFEGCSSLGSLNIPTTVTLIDDGCFRSCSSLTTININQLSITTLHNSCFSNCTSLNGVQIPTTVTTIEHYSFNNCSSWTGVLNLPSNLTSIGSSAFFNCKSLTGALTLPSKITFIGSSAFENCSGFTSLTFNCNISTIEYSTFQNCSSIANAVTIPSNVTSIGYSAFSGCKKIPRINFQTETAPTVGTGAFASMLKIIQVWIPKCDNYLSYKEALKGKGFVDGFSDRTAELLCGHMIISRNHHRLLCLILQFIGIINGDIG